MKMMMGISLVPAFTISASAQSSLFSQDAHLNMEVFNICATISVLILVMVFVLSIMQRILDHRLKNKIADKGVSENIAASILERNTKADKLINIKWFSLLTGLGTGLAIVSNFLPLGIHSFAIMSFSIAAGFLGYHIFSAWAEK